MTYRGKRSYVTLPAKLFEQGEQEPEDQAEGCGKVVGNGDRPGPMWIVDATDLSKLGPANDHDGSDDPPALKTASEAALVTTWTNAANRAAGNLTFSPHNQQIVGDLIFLSGYHSGVTVLDASAAFAGRKERPNERGFVVPTGTPTRPIYDQAVDPLLIPFFSQFIDYRPLIWDQFVYGGCMLVADMTGGFYSYAFEGVRCAGAARRAFVISERTVRMSRSGRIGVRVFCQSPLPCEGVLRLSTARRYGGRHVRLAVQRFRVGADTRVVLPVRLSRAGRTLVRRQGSVQTRALARVSRDEGGNPAFNSRASFRVIAGGSGRQPAFTGRNRR